MQKVSEWVIQCNEKTRSGYHIDFCVISQWMRQPEKKALKSAGAVSQLIQYKEFDRNSKTVCSDAKENRKEERNTGTQREDL